MTEVLIFALVIYWFFGSFFVAWAAKQRRRDGGNWFFLSLLFGPAFAMLGLIAAAAVPER